MQIYNIETNKEGRELTIHGSDDFPCAFYDERFSEFINGEVPWHWHDEIEVVLVLEGSTTLEYIGASTVINTGDMVLINAGMLHRLTNHGDIDCRILNVLFKPQILGGVDFGRVYKKYVYPVINNPEFLCYVFNDGHHWHPQIIQEMRLAFQAWQQETLGYEIIMTAALMKTWQQLCHYEPTILSKHGVSSIGEQRIHSLLSYIHCNYNGNLSVGSISKAAAISESECYRLFKKTLKCTPNQYLLHYRLRKATTLLLNSTQSITDISSQCGFNCSAYFAKQFRLTYNKTPKQFRKEGIL